MTRVSEELHRERMGFAIDQMKKIGREKVRAKDIQKALRDKYNGMGMDSTILSDMLKQFKSGKEQIFPKSKKTRRKIAEAKKGMEPALQVRSAKQGLASLRDDIRGHVTRLAIAMKNYPDLDYISFEKTPDGRVRINFDEVVVEKVEVLW